MSVSSSETRTQAEMPIAGRHAPANDAAIVRGNDEKAARLDGARQAAGMAQVGRALDAAPELTLKALVAQCGAAALAHQQLTSETEGQPESDANRSQLEEASDQLTSCQVMLSSRVKSATFEVLRSQLGALTQDEKISAFRMLYFLSPSGQGRVLLALDEESRRDLLNVGDLYSVSFSWVETPEDVSRFASLMKSAPPEARLVLTLALPTSLRAPLAAEGLSPSMNDVRADDVDESSLTTLLFVVLNGSAGGLTFEGRVAQQRWSQLDGTLRQKLLAHAWEKALGLDALNATFLASPAERARFLPDFVREAQSLTPPLDALQSEQLVAIRSEIADDEDRQLLDSCLKGRAFRELRVLAAARPREEVRADTDKVVAFLHQEGQARATQPRSVDTSSMFYQRLSEHYLKDYLAAPSPAAGDKAVADIGKPMSGPRRSDDYWEDNAPAWENQEVPSSLSVVRRDFPKKLGAATDVLRVANREKLPYLDVPQLIGDPNLDADKDADVKGGGKNMSQLMHWATGVKFAKHDKSTMRDLFLAYEMFHLEGWDVFGEDSINDMIAEDAGQLLGKQLQQGAINGGNLQAKLDEGFAEARAWVGSLLRGRGGALDAWARAEQPIPANFWWSREEEIWPTTIFQMLQEGASVADVQASTFVEHVLEIYTLRYEADVWEGKHGKIQNSGFIESMLKGELDAVLSKSVRGEPIPTAEKVDAAKKIIK